MGWGEEPVIATEKIDGTNVRIILVDDIYYIGSRADLLYAKGDRQCSLEMGIVDGVVQFAEALAPCIGVSSGDIFVAYGEFYGGATSSAYKQYTGSRETGFRLFDISRIPPLKAGELFRLQLEEISNWRKNDGPEWLPENELLAFSEDTGAPLVPRIGTIDNLPTTLQEGLDLLNRLAPKTQVALDDGALGQPEGIVIRSVDGKKRAKLRFQDYRKALKHSPPHPRFTEASNLGEWD